MSVVPKEHEKAFQDWFVYQTLKPIDRVQRTLRLGRLTIKYERRFRSNMWGRFGGGWNWKLGFQAGHGTLILNLLVASLRFHLTTGGPA